MRNLCITAALAFAAPATLAAQDFSAEEAAQRTADEMLAVQQVTAIAQRQFSGMVSGNIGSSYQGAIALPGAQDGEWLAIIVGRRGDGPDAEYVALAEYEIIGGALVSEVIHLSGDAPLLDGVASAMAQARSFAPRAVLATGAALCVDEGSNGSVNLSTIVLPPREDASFDAYVLNGPIEEGAVPLGKHWRVSFDQFGISGEPVLLTDTCEVVTWTDTTPGLEFLIHVTEHSGTAPSPVHIFLSTLVPMELGVVTGEVLWPIEDGTLGAPTGLPEAARDLPE